MHSDIDLRQSVDDFLSKQYGDTLVTLSLRFSKNLARDALRARGNATVGAITLVEQETGTGQLILDPLAWLL
jgi:hypothetical protein